MLKLTDNCKKNRIFTLQHYFSGRMSYKKVSGYDQKIPQSQIADQLSAPQ